MILNELSTVASEKMPLSEFSEHLHLGSGFADDGAQNSVLEAYLRAAIAAVEARTGKAVFQRRFAWVLYNWIAPGCQGLPISPVQSVESVRLIAETGQETVIDAGDYSLERDAHYPALTGQGKDLPRIAQGGQAEIILEAGYGPDWSDVPHDLQQSILMLAANYYDNRHGTSGRREDIPFGVMSLLEPFRKIRLSGGAR